jgi:hypothetical protein
MLPVATKEVVEAYPCTYPNQNYNRGKYENRMLPRDMHDLGAVYFEGVWFPARS